MPPLWLFVDGAIGKGPQRADRSPIDRDGIGRELGSRRFIHERHELVWETRHRAADADSADVGTSADACHPASLGDIAVHDRAPAADLHETLGRAVFGSEIALLVVPGAVAPFVHGGAKQPLG